VSLEQMGNSRARAVYEAMIPDGFRRPQTDSALESFIRAKYEHKKYLAREWVPPPAPKVDWDREIDEEIERQKRKKKASSSGGAGGSIGSVGGSLSLSSPADRKAHSAGGGASSAASPSSVGSAVPKLKAPASSMKPSSRNSGGGAGGSLNSSASSSDAASSQSAVQNTSAGTDLLGLSLGEGSLTPNHSSASNKPANGLSTTGGSSSNGVDLLERKNTDSDDLAKVEADFFNQAGSAGAGTGGLDASGKLTKDKIMALYGSAPSSGPTPLGSGFGGPAAGGFGGFQQAGSTFPPANGPGMMPANAFGAFQTFPTGAGPQPPPG
ncbi:AGAP012887-PA, partial [Anopheles gambiae str. PEST]